MMYCMFTKSSGARFRCKNFGLKFGLRMGLRLLLDSETLRHGYIPWSKLPIIGLFPVYKISRQISSQFSSQNSSQKFCIRIGPQVNDRGQRVKVHGDTVRSIQSALCVGAQISLSYPLKKSNWGHDTRGTTSVCRSGPNPKLGVGSARAMAAEGKREGGKEANLGGHEWRI